MLCGPIPPVRTRGSGEVDVELMCSGILARFARMVARRISSWLISILTAVGNCRLRRSGNGGLVSF